MGEIVRPAGGELELDLAADLAAALAYLAAAKSPATLRAYEGDWLDFMTWCAEMGADPLPAAPNVVAVYVASLARRGLRPSTIVRRLAAIRHQHLGRGHASPTDHEAVSRTVAGIRRTHGMRSAKKKPLTVAMLRDMVHVMPQTVRGRRDKALLLLGFAGAFRRSEVASLEVRHLEWVPEGLKVHLDKSKGNQEGRSEVVPILRGKDLCPVAAVQDWMGAARLIEGPIFRKITKGGRLGSLAVNDRFVAKMVKWYLFRAGYDHKQFSAHSLRSGFLTAAAQNRASLVAMQRVSRHKRVETLLEYVDQAEAFVDHAGEGLL